MLKTYDPNIRWARHTIEITYQVWEYTLTVSVGIKGNCRGMSLLSDAVRIHAEELFEQQGAAPTLVLVDPNGDTLECTCDDYVRDEDEDPDIDNWLEKMCVGVKFVGHAEEVR